MIVNYALVQLSHNKAESQSTITKAFLIEGVQLLSGMSFVYVTA